MKTVSPFRKLETEKENVVTRIDGLRASASRCFFTLAEHAGLNGGVYTFSNEYQRRSSKYGYKLSMRGKGNCFKNKNGRTFRCARNFFINLCVV